MPYAATKKVPFHECRELLLEKRREIIERLDAIKTESEGAVGEAEQEDYTVRTADRELARTNLEMDIRTLARIDLALRQIETQEYGLCESCGDAITPVRLLAIPWTRLCLACAGGSSSAQPPITGKASGGAKLESVSGHLPIST